MNTVNNNANKILTFDNLIILLPLDQAQTWNLPDILANQYNFTFWAN